MKSRIGVYIAVAALALCLQPLQAMATNVQVGSCKGTLPKYTTISAAVSAASPGATVFVCPGTYAEQVEISQPLTLQGVAEGSGDQPLIVSPIDGLTILATIGNQGVSPQIYATGAGPVNIVGLSLDGTNSYVSCYNSSQAGILLYNVAGTVNHVLIRNQSPGGCGRGVFFVNQTSNVYTDALLNSSIHDVDASALEAGGSVQAGLTLNIRGNSIRGSNQTFGMYFTWAGPATVAGNTIVDAYYGVYNYHSTNTISGNLFLNDTDGVYVINGGATINSNRFMADASGIVENCTATLTAQSNTFTDVNVGILYQNGTATGNAFYDAATTIQNGCQ
jgi:copper-binding protein NosD